MSFFSKMSKEFDELMGDKKKDKDKKEEKPEKIKEEKPHEQSQDPQRGTHSIPSRFQH